MKRILALVLVIFTLSSCIISDIQNDMAQAERYSGYELYRADFSRIQDEIDIYYYIKKRVTFRHTDGAAGPAETIERGYGDCEEFTILFLNILYVRFGIKGEMILVNIDRSIENGGKANHALVRLPDGRQIEPQTGRWESHMVAYYYTFDEIFN